MKQVTAAPPSAPQHLVTKGHLDAVLTALGINIPSIPQLPMPPLPPGVTLPPGITLPPLPRSKETFAEPGPKLFEVMEARIAALERRVAELESRTV